MLRLDMRSVQIRGPVLLLEFAVLCMLISPSCQLTPRDLEFPLVVEQRCRNNSLTFFKHTLAKTTNNNDVYVIGVTFSNDESRKEYLDFLGSPAILLTAVMHPREDTSFRFLDQALGRIIQEFANGNEQVRYLLSRVVLLVMPFVNIDAVLYSFNLPQSQVLNLRKNMNAKGSSNCRTVSDRGVDINRNFDYKFGSQLTSVQPCSEEYHGAFPFSEPESQAIGVLFEQFRVTTNVDIHSYGNIWIYPYASEQKTDKIKQHRLYRQYELVFKKLKQVGVNFDNCYNSLKYVADGVYIDWALSKNSLSFALEFGDDFYQMGTQVDRNIQALLQVFRLNTNEFQYYLKLDQKQGSQQAKLCIRSLSLLEHNIILMLNQQAVEGMRLPADSTLCFNNNFQNLLQSEQTGARTQKIFVKFGQSDLKEEIHLGQLQKQKKPAEVEAESTWLSLAKQFRILIILAVVLCGIGCLCGLSIFFEGSLGLRMANGSDHELNFSPDSNERSIPRNSRMLRILRGQVAHGNPIMESEIQSRIEGNEVIENHQEMSKEMGPQQLDSGN